MKQSRLTALVTTCAAIAVVTFISNRNVYGQDHQEHADGHGNEAENASMPIYNPYPQGVLPSDLASEIQRVRREENSIEQKAISEWFSLPPPTVTGNPPIQQNTGTAAVETLGKLMNFDEHISVNQNMACSFCHMPYTGFSGPIP
jgi:hypothetical protein